MVSLEQQEKIVYFNSQYQDNSELINRLQEKLLRDINILNLSKKDLLDSKEYLQDKVTLFRFLRETKFDFDKAHEKLLETIRWRMDMSIPDLTWESSIEFFSNNEGALTFYHKADKTDRPLLFVRLRLFPTEFQDKSLRLLDHIQKFACFILEVGRKLTWEMTCERARRNEACVLVSQMTVLVNIQKAPMIPIDAELIRTISMILETKFPGMVGTVNILNFGWMYQGIWSLVKLLLSEEAKKSLRFTNVSELSPVISPDNILQEMGGNDDYQWTFESDEAIQKYGVGKHAAQEPPVTPPISEEDRSRSNSITSDEEEDDEFFDAQDSLPSIPITLPVDTVVQERQIMPRHPPKSPSSGITLLNSNYGNLSNWVGLRMGVDFLTSFVDTKPSYIPHHREIPPPAMTHTLSTNINNNDMNELRLPPSTSDDIILVNIDTSVLAPTTTDMAQPPLDTTIISIAGLKRIELLFKRLTHQILYLSYGQRGMVYWVLLYVFLRGPVESLVKRSLTHTSLAPQRITTATIGLTAAMAAVVGTSLSSSSKRKRLPPPPPPPR